MAHPPDAFNEMFMEELDRHADSRGLLPIPLQKASYAALDRMVTQLLADKGIDRATIAQYRTALRSAIDELLADKRDLNPGLPVTGADVTDRAEKLLISRGTTAEDATLSEYMTALADARDVLDLEGRRDILVGLRKRLIGDHVEGLANLVSDGKLRIS